MGKKFLYGFAMLVFAAPLQADDQDKFLVDIEEYITAYKAQITEMRNKSLQAADAGKVGNSGVATYIDEIIIEMSVVAKRDAAGKIRLWAIEAGGGFETTEVQKHVVKLSFGADGRQRVADAAPQQSENGVDGGTTVVVTAHATPGGDDETTNTRVGDVLQRDVGSGNYTASEYQGVISGSEGVYWVPESGTATTPATTTGEVDGGGTIYFTE